MGRKLHFPQVVQTSPGPDVVLRSEEAKKSMLIELMVSWEDGIEEASEWKNTKYRDLIPE